MRTSASNRIRYKCDVQSSSKLLNNILFYRSYAYLINIYSFLMWLISACFFIFMQLFFLNNVIPFMIFYYAEHIYHVKKNWIKYYEVKCYSNRITLKNITRQKWNFKDGVKVHVIFNFYYFYISKIQQNTASYKII